MTSPQHILAGATIATFTGAVYYNITNNWTNLSIIESVKNIRLFLIPVHPVLKLLFFILFVLGTLLPDCDTPESWIGRFFYLPIGHRTITHTLWVNFIFFFIGMIWKPLMGIALGYFCHLLCDAFSRQGICWLYPLGRYRYFWNGARVKDYHFFFLYNSVLSGWIVCGIMIILTTMYISAIGSNSMKTADAAMQTFLSLYI